MSGWPMTTTKGVGITYQIAIGKIPVLEGSEFLDEEFSWPVYVYQENGKRVWHCDQEGTVYHGSLAHD